MNTKIEPKIEYWITYKYGFTVFRRGPYDTRAEAGYHSDDVADYKDAGITDLRIFRATKTKKRKPQRFTGITRQDGSPLTDNDYAWGVNGWEKIEAQK